MAGAPSESKKKGTPASKQTSNLLGSLDKWWRIAAPAVRESFAPESQLVASSIAFFTLFSVFPLVLLVIAIGSNWLDPLLIEARLVEQLEFAVPALESLLGDNLESLVARRGSVTGIALLSLFWSSTSIFNVLTRVMDRIWGVDINERRSIWRHRGLAIVAVLILTGILLIVSLAEGTIVTILNSFLPQELATLEPLTTEFWTAMLSVVLFTILYYYLPHIRLTWRSVLPGAIVAGLLWELAKRLFLTFIGAYLSRSNLIYGSVGSIIAFLGWAYVSSLILLLGAYVNRGAVVAQANAISLPVRPEHRPDEASQ